MYEFYYAILSVVLLSLVSLIGIFTIFLKRELTDRIIHILVAFAIGSLLGAAFFDILPEIAQSGNENIFAYVLFGLLMFFVMERYIYWHHCHSGNCKNSHHHPVTYLNLIGDAFHNFVDGALIAASFLVSVPIGIVTIFAIATHEIPQELSDFAILVHGGFSKKRAMIFNFLSSLTAILGVVITFLFAKKIEGLIPIILAVAAGGFIYIATADLIPEIHKEKKSENIVIQSVVLMIGVLVVFAITTLFEY
ncbi:MAG: ZIP family metal transporter [Patescibacteria group bacterium]|nr:ZIP family metal transporter [Patescibacteria group bacterium]